MTPLLWLLCLAVLAAACLLSPSPALWCAAALWLLAPVLSWLLLWLCRRRLRPEIVCPATAEKGTPLPLTLCLHAPKWLPLGTVRFRLEVENTVTGERQSFRLCGASRQLTLESRFCGCLRLRISRVTVRDAFGIFPVFVRPAVQRQLCILPNTFPVRMEFLLSAAEQECRQYDPRQKGSDRTETYQIRDYAPGDSLRQIHWKLSGKAGRLIVRDPARPMDHTLRIFVARQKAEPAFADALLEAAVSVCQALENRPFCLMWNEDSILCSREISGTDTLMEALTELMKAPAQEALPAWDAPCYGTLLYFCCRPPETLPENAVLFLCNGQTPEWPDTIVFTPDNLREKLEKLTWSSTLS